MIHLYITFKYSINKTDLLPMDCKRIKLSHHFFRNYLDIEIIFRAESRIFEGAGGVSRTPGASGASGVDRPGDYIAALAIVTHVISR